MNIPQDWAFFIISQIVAGAAIYGGIRADLREALTRINMLETRLTRLEDRS